jgi:transcriptional regulator with XRE-family HTH domain
VRAAQFETEERHDPEPVGLQDRILDYLRSHGPSQAKQIANALNVDRTTVNQILYGSLRERVKQSKNYNWQLFDFVNKTPHIDSLLYNSQKHLFKYYLDCLSYDDDSGISAYADSQFGLDYVELGEWPLESPDLNAVPDALKKLAAQQLQGGKKKALWLGFPTRVRQAQNKTGTWKGAFLEPLLIWRQDPDAGSLAFLPEPMINMQALKGLNGGGSILEEAALLADELGLDTSDLPPIDELVLRLREIRPEWDWREPSDPNALRPVGELPKITDSGIYNAAIVVLTDHPQYTVGLEHELTDLMKVSDAQIADSALGILLGAPTGTTPIEGPLLEPAPLNAEQRTAVRRALAEPLTVITGPPGTGKSQVVTEILVNAAWRGLRVLFASKNNKAVDVVIERVNALSPRPVVLRLGTQTLSGQLAQHISAILSAQPTNGDRLAYKNAIAKLECEAKALDECRTVLDRLISLRNQVDRLERQAEAARGVLPPHVFGDGALLESFDPEAPLARLREAVRRSDYNEARLFERIFWALLRKSRLKSAIRAADELS